MRLRYLLIGLPALLATAAAALAPGGAMPDISRQYYQRQNCHLAYDLLIETMKAGTALSDAERAWGKVYEDNGASGKPCPEPDAALAARAANRTVTTLDGLGMLAKYHKQDDPAAFHEAGLSVLAGKVPQVGPGEGFGMLVKADSLGHAPASFLVGALYVGGSATGKQDYAGGFPYIVKAAEAGHVDALFMLANMYSAGLGTKKDEKKGFLYYSQAAERGHVYAAYLAAYMANSGEGTRKDHNLAYRLARNLADQGEVVGAVLAASALLQQKNAKEHENEVLYWMDVAIRDGDEKIRTEIGKLRPQVVAAYTRAKAPPEYRPRVRKACPMKTVCLVNRFTNLQSCTTNKDYWNDCDF